MDWTGGTRRRYAPTGRKSAVLQKQKAHFAKVRANGAAYLPHAVPDFIRQSMAAKPYGHALHLPVHSSQLRKLAATRLTSIQHPTGCVPGRGRDYARVLHVHQERFFEPTMSGAIQNHDVQVKIGTDAFASQTQRSRKSRSPINTSLRHPSTDFGSLPEEPMLMDEEDANFLKEMEIFGFVPSGVQATADDPWTHARAESRQGEEVDAATCTQYLPSMQISTFASPEIACQLAPVVPHMIFKDTGCEESWEGCQRSVARDQDTRAAEGVSLTS
ncbi:hypothetical protein BST61_g4700 [Cercospora zeina]